MHSNNDEEYDLNYSDNDIQDNIPTYNIEYMYEDIIKSLEENVITFISSKTGSGKSTQVPKYLYEYLKTTKKKSSFKIICSEPRTIACESISQYVKLLNPDINIYTKNIEYLANEKEPGLFFLKESDLLFLLKLDPYLKNCDILIIDEVHERTMKLELLLYYLKHFTLCQDNIKRGFKLIFMSATFNTGEIHSYLSSSNKPELTFGFLTKKDSESLYENNYDVVYRNPLYNSMYIANKKFNEFNIKKILREIVRIVGLEAYSGDYIIKTILIFVPDYKTIYSLYNMLNKEYRGDINLYQFCSALNPRQQKEIIDELNFNNNRRIRCNVIIATTLAETCLTFPNCDVVIDSGLKKNCKYNYDCYLYEETIEYISQDSCIQRSGRCGRGMIRGTAYRVFSEETFNMMDKFRKPEIEVNNIDLIILKLFENDIITDHIKKEIKEKGYIDFLSKIEGEKYEKIYKNLCKYNALDNEKITNFGNWAMKANMDIELGYYFNKFLDKYESDIFREPVFQLLNIISTSDNYNCELFYTDVDPDFFKLSLINNDRNAKNIKTLADFSKTISNNIINQALTLYKSEEDKNMDLIENKIKIDYEDIIYGQILDHIYPYYYLFSKLDEIYNAKNYFIKNKIFQMGDWLISLFFINQYKLIKCLRHNYFEEEEERSCIRCKTGKYYYCLVYSLNEKFFIKQNTKTEHLKSILKLQFINEKDFTVCEKEEKIIAKWNIIYLNLISGKPDIYISNNQIIKYINQFNEINFEEILDTLYIEYKKLYIDIASKYLEITKNDDEMLIQRKIFENKEGEEYKIELFFNSIDKTNLMQSYFFSYIPKNIDKFFCLKKFRKIYGTHKNNDKSIKISKLFYKMINPIFDEMINKSEKLKNHFNNLQKNIIDKKDIKVFSNVGKHFYNEFIAPKLSDKNIELHQNNVIYIYSLKDKDFNKEDRIEDLIKNEKDNYCNMIDFIQCLNGGCITIQLTQGLNVKNIFDTYQNRNINKNKLLYYIKFNDDYDESKDINYYKNKISENKDLKYEELISLPNNLIIVFNDSLQFSLFSKKQNLNLKFIPYKQNIQNISQKKEENIKKKENNMKIFLIKFERRFSLSQIHSKMQNYKKRILSKYNYKLFYYIDEKSDSDSLSVYYYIKSDIPVILNKNDIIGEECLENLNNKIFSINWFTITSDYEYIQKFLGYCTINHLNIVRKLENNLDKNVKRNYSEFSREYELINYTIENMKLIQNYIGYTTIILNSFALLELKTRSKDTFLQQRQNIFSYARNNLCKINIIYNENKFIIYGAPIYRKKLYDEISNYFKKLQEEKIIYSLNKKESALSLKTLKRKLNREQMTVLIYESDNKEIKLEFRKKYFDFISEILDIEKNKKKKNKNKKDTYKINTTRCEICLEKFDNIINNNYFKLKLCGHKFCIECLKMQICDSLNLTTANSIPIKCIKCHTIITNNDIFEVIVPNTKEYDFVINKLINLFILRTNTGINYDSNIKYYYCPNKEDNCNYIYSSQIKDLGETSMTCPNCSCKICLLCNNILDPYTPHDPNCQTKLYSKLSKKNRKWLLTNSKDCPMCHTVYAKDQGCNHMTCTRCNPPVHFCYLCGNILNDENPLKHFSDKNSKCCGKLWDDPKKNNEIEQSINDSIEQNEESDESDEYKEDSKEYENNNINNFSNGNNYNNNNVNSDENELTRIMLEKVNNHRYYNSSNKMQSYSNNYKKYN